MHNTAACQLHRRTTAVPTPKNLTVAQQIAPVPCILEQVIGMYDGPFHNDSTKIADNPFKCLTITRQSNMLLGTASGGMEMKQ